MVAKLKSKLEHGQAMVEFALSLPILLLFIIGIINFGIVLFSYSHGSNQLRNALRYSEIMGYYTDTTATVPYLDCTKMEQLAERSWFGSNREATISYIKTDGSNKFYYCARYPGDPLETPYATLKEKIKSGDILHIKLTADVKLLFMPIGPLQLSFEGERSILLSVDVDPVTP